MFMTSFQSLMKPRDLRFAFVSKVFLFSVPSKYMYVANIPNIFIDILIGRALIKCYWSRILGISFDNMPANFFWMLLVQLAIT